MSESNSPPIASAKIVCENKIFFVDLKENSRGKFLKITEDVNGRRDTILMPLACVNEFIVALHDVMKEGGVS